MSDTEKRKKRDETTVGVFVVIGFILFTVGLFLVSGVYFFRSGYTMNVLYDYVSILDRGAPVRMAGVRIGEVSDVALFHDETRKEMRVRVKLFIEKGVEIRENYAFHIQGTHILSEPHIEVTPSSGDAKLLGEGATLNGQEPVPIEALVKQGHSIAHNLDEMISGLRETLQDEPSREALHNILVNMASLTKSLDMILTGSEEDFKNAIKNIEASSASMQALFLRAQQGEGTIGKLLEEDALYQDMRDFVAEIKARPWRLLKRDEKDENSKKFLIF